METQSPPSSSARVFAPGRLGAIAVLSALVSMVGFAVIVSPVQGKPFELSEFNKKYDTRGTKLDSCQTCHTSLSPDAEHINNYGADFHNHNHDFGSIEPRDSDGDRFNNLDEIKARTFPGNPYDYPGAEPSPKPAPTATTTTRPFPFSLLPDPHAGNADVLRSILDGKE